MEIDISNVGNRYIYATIILCVKILVWIKYEFNLQSIYRMIKVDISNCETLIYEKCRIDRFIKIDIYILFVKSIFEKYNKFFFQNR